MKTAQKEAIEAEASAKNPAEGYSVSGGFVNLMRNLNISLAMTSYQSGKLYLMGNNPAGGLMINERRFQKAMGIHISGNNLVLATLFQIHFFENMLKPKTFINNTHDACFMPRVSHITGVR